MQKNQKEKVKEHSECNGGQHNLENMVAKPIKSRKIIRKTSKKDEVHLAKGLLYSLI